MENIKVIILYNRIFHYRIPVWNLLAEKCDLTVTYSDVEGEPPSGIECKFKIQYLPAWKIKEKFVVQKASIRKLVKNYDVVIAYGDIAWLKFSTLPWFNNTKVIFHSIGVSANYEKGFDAHHEWDRIRAFFYSKASALIFYTSYPFSKYVQFGISQEKMFEAPNTVEVHPLTQSADKDSILFIGTLYRQKGIQALLDSYLELKNEVALPKLIIIGKGPDSENIKKWIDEYKMNDLVVMKGAIYDIDEKARYFAKALACISPKQAGLSVLESMGYGVPFVTTRDAITGGEIFNIHNEKDGVVLQNIGELSSIVKDIALNKKKYIGFGQEAQIFYNQNRTPQHMADGFWKAIQYVHGL